MSGGRLEIGDDMSWGDNGGGELNLSGGDIIIGGGLAFGSLRGSTPITLNMSGGSISIAGAWECPSNSMRAGAVSANLDAGVIECNEFVHGSVIEGQPSYTDDWHVDIEEGVLIIGGDVKAAIDANVAAGQITAYGGDGTVLVELVDGNTVVTAWPADPNTATGSYPPHRSKHIDPNVVCHWTPGINAASHDVYFGTDFNDVNDATTSDAVYQDNIEPNEWDPCGVGIPLDELRTYYWRIDEKNGSTWKGRVWHFTTIGPVVDPNMLIWYKFDEANGVIAYDSSGYDNDGPIGLDDEKEVQAPTWSADGHDGGCLIFNDDTVVQPPQAVLSDIGGGISFSVWLKDTSVGGDNWIFDAGGGEGAARHLCAAVPDSSGAVYWRAGNDTNDVCVWTGAEPAEWMGYWRHFVFVKNENAGRMRIYYDGKQVAEQTDVVAGTLADFQGDTLAVGTEAWDNFDYEGAMDEFRLYDRALSATEVETLFRGGEIGLAWEPDPADGAIDVPRDVVLSWSSGKYAQDVNAHDVYFGTSFNDVNDANTAETLGVYQGSSDLDANSYARGILELERSYYWRIDEVNDSNVESPWKGNVWQFRVANFLIVDDMETYCPTASCGNEIQDTWVDGWINNSGAEVFLGEDPTEPVRSGKQSMEYAYDSGDSLSVGLDYYSEVERVLADACDWTEAGVKMLTLFFYAEGDNDANEQMYAGLEDSRGGVSYAQVNYGFYGEDMNDVRQAEWHQWDMALADFGGVDLNDVGSLYVGFGERGEPYGGTPGGSGVVYFDDIRLYRPKCVAERLKPRADITNDCMVDMRDVGELAEQWLRTDQNELVVVNPGTTGLVGWWKLDEAGGSSVNDSSSFGNHGTLMGPYSWVEGRDANTAVRFRGGKVMVPDSAALRPAAQVSVCAWVNYAAAASYSARVVVKGADQGDRECYALQVGKDDEASWFIRDANTQLHGADSEDELAHNEWIHIAGTYDSNEVRSYVNGRLWAAATVGPLVLLQDTNDLAIGNRSDANDRAFHGTVGEVRVYNRGLSEAEVAWLATDGTGYVPLRSAANLYDQEPAGEEVVNFKDLDVLLDYWLEAKLWPGGQ
jgi:hypothetical protein